MILRPYYYDDRGCAAYVFACGRLGQCAAKPDGMEQILAFNRGHADTQAPG